MLIINILTVKENINQRVAGDYERRYPSKSFFKKSITLSSKKTS